MKLFVGFLVLLFSFQADAQRYYKDGALECNIGFHIYEINGLFMYLGGPNELMFFSYHDLLEGKHFYKRSLWNKAKSVFNFKIKDDTTGKEFRGLNIKKHCYDTVIYRGIVLKYPLEILGGSATKNTVLICDSFRLVENCAQQDSKHFEFYLKRE